MSGTVGELTREQLEQRVWDLARQALQGHVQRGVMEGFYVTSIDSGQIGRCIIAEMYSPPSERGGDIHQSTRRGAGRSVFPLGSFASDYPLEQLQGFVEHSIATTFTVWSMETARRDGTPVARDWGEA